ARARRRQLAGCARQARTRERAEARRRRSEERMTEQHKSDEHATSKGATPGTAPLVAVVMGSTSDWETMRHASEVLERLEVPHTCQVVSAHRTPERLAEFGKSAAGRGIQVIVAGAGGAAHLPGMIAANTHLPVFGVPVMSE